jgi:catechol 2,3-dioxygenase-like lactoylglutathione lyase family enzyme
MTTSTSTERATPAAIENFSALKPRVLYVGYHVNDIERALAFYVGVLGMKEQLRVPLGKGEHEVVLGFPEGKSAGVILMWNTERKTPYVPGDAYSRFILSVSDIDAALAHLAKHGTSASLPVTDAGRFRYAMVKDPDGYLIELLQPKA